MSMNSEIRQQQSRRQFTLRSNTMIPKSISYVINSTFRKISNTRLQDIVDVCLKMFSYCIHGEPTTAIRQRKFLNKFSVINNVVCQVFAVNANKELESLLAHNV